MVLASTGTGDIIPDATVTVRNPGTTTNISETIYANDDPDTTQLTNGVFKTDARGLAIFYLTNQKRVDVLFTKAGVTSVTIPVDVQKSSLVSGESVAASTIWDAAGDLAKGTGADTAARLARGTANQVLRTNAGGTDIEWGVEQARDIVTTAGDITYATAADTLARLAIGTAGQVLKVNAGATAPEWGAAAGGSVGALLDYKFARKTAIESVTSSTTLQDDDHLIIALGTSQTWEFTAVLYYDASGAEVPDFKFAFVGPASASGNYQCLGPVTGITGASSDAQWGNGNISGATADPQSFGAAGDVHVLVHGIIVTGATAGNLQLQWAQNTSDGNATRLFTNSYLVARRVA